MKLLFVIAFKGFFGLLSCLESKDLYKGHHFCVPPAPPSNGKVSLGRGDVVVRYSCNPGFKLIGTPVAVCIAGKWSSPKPKCRLKGKFSEKNTDAASSSANHLEQKDQQIVSVYDYDPAKKNEEEEDKEAKKMRSKDRKRKKRRQRNKGKRKHRNRNKLQNYSTNEISKTEKSKILDTGDNKNTSASKPSRRRKEKRKKRRRKRKERKGTREVRRRKRQRKSKRKNSSGNGGAGHSKAAASEKLPFLDSETAAADGTSKTASSNKQITQAGTEEASPQREESSKGKDKKEAKKSANTERRKRKYKQIMIRKRGRRKRKKFMKEKPTTNLNETKKIVEKLIVLPVPAKTSVIQSPSKGLNTTTTTETPSTTPKEFLDSKMKGDHKHSKHNTSDDVTKIIRPTSRQSSILNDSLDETPITTTSEKSVPIDETTSSKASTSIPLPVEKGRDLLQDIISRMKHRDKIAPNLFDFILAKKTKKKGQKGDIGGRISAEESDDNRKEIYVTTRKEEEPHEKKKEVKEVNKKEENSQVKTSIEAEPSSNHLKNDLNLDSDSDYDNNISGYDEYYEPLPDSYSDSYPDSYKPDYLEKEEGSSSRTTPSHHGTAHYNHSDVTEDKTALEVGERSPQEGYPSPEKRLYDEDEVKSAKERFVEEEDIDFATLDTSCIISEIDSLYLPPPRVKHSHVTTYTTVTNPAPPNNVYVEAVYECDFGYQLKEATSNRLFCKKDKWVGSLAECIAYGTGDGVCGPRNGGCEQICDRNEDKKVCSCYRGFTLREDGKSCSDIDECQTNNGDCEAVCFNKLGSHQCYCPRGYRLATNGKTCIDKNECILRNGHGPCQDTCYNTEGSYYCTCEGMFGTKLGADKHTCEDVDECAVNNGGCSHICLNTFGQTFCTCPLGFILDMDWKTCQDINECDYPEVLKECNNRCVNTPGSYHCGDLKEFTQTMNCSTGLRIREDKKSCEDIDECDDEAFGCSHTCVNTFGSAHCECPTGYHLTQDGKLCKDLNECEDSPCSHECIDLEGSFSCTCPKGMILGPDLEVCIDINECAINNGNCSQLCTNDIGTYKCGCRNGFSLHEDGATCVDVNECKINNGNCDQLCVNIEGEFFCTCIDGYEMEDDLQCADIDECALQKSGCEHLCENTKGSYQCICHKGYTLASDNKSCIDVDECGVGNKCSHFCSNQNGTYVCHCPEGWKLTKDNHTCEDYNECEEENGGCSHMCHNKEGGYECSCPTGMTLILEGTSFDRTHLCIDIDECETNNGNCSHICENTEGGYKCKCPKGFRTYESTNGTVDIVACKDIDECVDEVNDCSHICANTEGSYECQCPEGYKLQSDEHSCEDINECLKENGGCSHNCLNLLGSYECTCPEGWDIDFDYDNEATYLEGMTEPWKTCIDINECEKLGNLCSHECVNKKGGFQCKCPPGYILIDDFQCEDVNECLVDDGGCSHSCLNLEGSFVCHCPPGFQLVDSTRCLDINECLTLNGNCSDHCINEMGGYRCSCPEGFLMEADNITCTDFNECGKSNGGCSHECHNTDGQYTCSCPPGMKLRDNGHICEDINECDFHNGGCSSECRNTAGSFECLCPLGLNLAVDKKSCLDFDECGVNNGGCSHQCSNKEGHYSCLCPSGYSLRNDNHTCVDIDECGENNAGCSYKCLNTEGSFRCFCKHGFELGKDNKTCHDFNECLLNNGGCTGQCHNTRGSFRCECPSGFRLGPDGSSCEDLDECSIAKGGCSHICSNSVGSFACECPPGYLLGEDRFKCQDINECDISPCEHNCINTEGSFYCACSPGFRSRPDSSDRCWDVNECDTDNGGCSQECLNTIGSYQCNCKTGFKLSEDKHTCTPKSVFCSTLIAPAGGYMKCSNEADGDMYKSGTVCTFQCSEGRVLRGEDKVTCTELGRWTSTFASCESVRCPSLSEVEHGRVAPSRCTRGSSSAGDHCYLTCSTGYKVMGNPVRTCSNSGVWLPEEVSPYCEKDIIKPFIQCPNDVIVDLGPHQNIAYVRLPKPKSNVDWFRFIDATPDWAKDLEVDLPAGRTTITFVARSPLTEFTDSCSFVVFVRDTESPLVFGCPKSFHVQLEPAKNVAEVTWVEPVFKDNVEVSHIYKSMESGRKLPAGTYPVHYVAVDPQRNRAKCSFVITVEAAPPVQRLYQSNQVWVACPGLNGGRPIQMFAWRVPPDCTVTNPSSSVLHAPWEPTHIHSEVPSVSSVGADTQLPKMGPTQEASAYDGLEVSQAFSTNSKPPPGEWGSSSAFAFANKMASQQNNKAHNRGREPIERQPKLGSFYKNTFSHLLRGRNFPQTFALAHARAGTLEDGTTGTSSFAHAQTDDENVQALAHAHSSMFNYG